MSSFRCQSVSRLRLLAFVLPVLVGVSSAKPPNIVFLVCESTDGRTWREGYQDNVIPLPNLRQLEAQPGGYSFHRHYSNSPVCCTSRSTLWSGRHAHKIPHIQRQQHTDKTTGKKSIRELAVNGAWNNFEGLPVNFQDRIDQILERSLNYTVKLSGKRDWTTGGHTDNVKMSAWTMYTRFPYNIPKQGGWADELPYVCGDNGTVRGPNTSPHWDDWKALNETVDWMKDYRNSQENGTIDKDKPFFVYQGMNIVHPPYLTNEHWYNKIDPNKINVPEWIPLEELHPCDLQSSMMKGCIPPMDNDTARDFFYDYYRRRNIRRIYYAMIAEFDSMVGAYMDTIQQMGQDVWDNTIFIVTSDHGDMQIEHQQSYKQVPYDGSSSVPLIIMDGRVKQKQKQKQDKNKQVIDLPTQLMDLYPTMMDMAGVPSSDYPYDKLDGHSLVPLMQAWSQIMDPTLPQSVSTTKRPDFIVSQFHGMNIAMSWFLIVRVMPCAKGAASEHLLRSTTEDKCAYKLVIWGTGKEVDSQLFDLTHDPDEMTNLIQNDNYQSITTMLEGDLRSVVNYPEVALDVAAYNKDSMRNWMEVLGEKAWREAIHRHQLNWDTTWEHDSAGAFAALAEWINSTKVEVLPCRSDLVWPPPPGKTQPEEGDAGATMAAS
ncbi:Arylsulfatase K [Seminavis robusta]|uniref:Arylsulfatase K n=1 Tax=Seminavis robusta TaxID=568900 RepID=A0A9N8EM95_9STRA|nr:Arylsulfatase K [Seminavis robusta]|eukprot:Sro1215_g253140.1 Arylsulfatase K (654) ;mRNA; f:3431-5561